MHMLEIIGCHDLNQSMYKLREYGAVLQTWDNLFYGQEAMTILMWPIGFDIAAELGKKSMKSNICPYWKISNGENQDNFGLENPQQGN